ncbi:uncharacterized protein LOC113385304 [Ctenocephalides felis]|uniref:uncharacterized protein LOC113385304 n=1 Tax=Ctenocephalides felis TaxID=7515 RepID=UPI000E6E341C|nr:uncharacterized protein LOC113385304 [Ctenocephalides felis]
MNAGRKNKQVRGSDDYNSSKKQKSESGPSKRRKNKTSDLNFEDDNFILDDLDTKSDDYEDLGDLVSKIGSKFEKSLFEKQKATDQLAESILKIGTDLIENVLKEQSEKRTFLENEFIANIKTMLKKLDAEMKLAATNEEKLRKALQQHMNYSQQKLVMLNKLHQDIFELFAKYCDSDDEINKAQQEELEAAKAESISKMNKEKQQYIKDLSDDNMANVKKTILKLFK